MSQLLPTSQAEHTREALSEYLQTSFNLADREVREAFESFLADPDDGIFRGPYVRMRMPFKPALEVSSALDVLPRGFAPYGHQAEAFARLSSRDLNPGERPKPTLVTTGTGSGKTEAFLYPILEHVVRHKLRGGTGISGLILYPMNALATDQAQRLAKLIFSNEQLAGIRAAIYTGDAGDTKRSTVTADGLINDRDAIRENPPDILLTNYKMLDQLLLRPKDQKLWEVSALSLQYLVLDEFHTYDGAQGTDVAMLLRRLGVKLKSYLPADQSDITAADRERPLGRITPVATSATLGDNNEPGGPDILDFAQTVFGEPFTTDSVVTESRYNVDEWALLFGAELTIAQQQLTPLDPADAFALNLRDALRWISPKGFVEASLAPEEQALRALSTLYAATDDWESVVAVIGTDTGQQLTLVKQHPFIKRLLAATTQACFQDDLARDLLAASDAGKNPARTVAQASEYLSHIIAALSVIRAGEGLAAPTVDVHMWVRAVSRIDRGAGGMGKEFSWSDDGQETADRADVSDSGTDSGQLQSWAKFPAIYCRNCGRSGWGVTTGPVGQTLAAQSQDKDIRKEKANNNRYFRALISAGAEADRFEQSGGNPDARHENLAAFHVENREILDAGSVMVDSQSTDGIQVDWYAGKIEPVLVWGGGRSTTDADKKSIDDYCPACGERDSIRFLGAAVATLLSVTLSTLFGDQTLTAAEKKSLVFTDSVQDAAHRAGFAEHRSHVLTMRNVIAHAVGDGASLDLVADHIVTQAGADSERRYRILPPEFSQDRFKDVQAWWANPGKRNSKARDKVLKRLAFDAALEFGLQNRYGRTLSRTGTVAAEVALPSTTELASLAGEVLAQSGEKYGELALESVGAGDTGGSDSSAACAADPSHGRAAWVRGVVERLRTQGAIHHPWLDTYIADSGFRIWIWGKRKRGQGMPAFPGDRNGPAFAITGSANRRKRGKNESLFDPVESPQGWYADYTAKLFGLSRHHAAGAVKLLLQTLAQRGLIREFNTKTDETAKVYGLEPRNVLLEKPYDAAGDGEDIVARDGEADSATPELTCSLCQAEFPLASDAMEQLDGTPCLMGGCTGRLNRGTIAANFYRRLYTSSDMHRIVAREHSGLLQPEVRKDYEDGFKNSQGNPAAPNVLVATPTLEMGIDIGDLSAVMLASLPKTVASYVQRVGRAGRLTGNALNLAFVEGRGKNLPTVQNPLSMINGAVRPPATYLDAVEMIKRQYIAFLIDKLAQEEPDGFTWPVNARNVFTGDPGQSAFLNRVLALNNDHSGQLLDEFLGTFGHALNLAGDDLREWATPDADGTGTTAGNGPSGMRQMIWDAHRAFNQQIESLQQRLTAIDQALPDLLGAAGNDLDTASEDAKRALQEAKAARGATNRALADQGGEYWIAAMEAAQLLPNYTLLDDTTELSVDVRWRDEDTQAFKNARVSFDRGATLALRDFALGSTFYGRGMQINIDALDRGPNDQDQYTLAMCGQCGFSMELQGSDVAPPLCPRCQDESIADVGQHLPAVHLRQVSAMVNRDESAITDADDDRKKRTFTVQSLADIDMNQLADRWYVDGYNFGVAYLKNVTITSVNFGQRGGGREVLTGGETVKSPGFVICESCGKQDSTTNGNSPLDHRPWCKHRKAIEEHNVQVVLTHQLRTQGSLIRLPENLLIGNQSALPSLVAAIRLGLSKHLGGDPDHIHVMMAREPIVSGATSTGVADALLLHDTVPGGTGYLADLSLPETVWGILHAAWQTVRSCHCKDEEKWACGDCLLPYATQADTGKVSRAIAENLLSEILLGGRDASVEEMLLWPVTQEAPTPADPDSYLEKSFRKVFRSRLETAGLDVQELPGPTGIEWTIHQPSSHTSWRLREQETVENFVRPDFLLECRDNQALRIAIFTDGFAYHASHVHNKIADDVVKRQRLRDMGWAVVSITADEVRRAESASTADDRPLWFDSALVAKLNQQPFGWSSKSDGFLGNPMDLLVAVVQSVTREELVVPKALRYAANGSPMFLASPAQGARPVVLPAGDEPNLLGQAVLGEVTGKEALAAASAAVDGNGSRVRLGLLCNRGPLTTLVEMPGSGRVDIAAVLDDRDEALDDSRFKEAWAEWLHLSNLCGYREAPSRSIVASVQQMLAEAPAEVADAGRVAADVGASSGGVDDFVADVAAGAIELSPEWQELLDNGDLEPEEAAFILDLHNAGVTDLPNVGEESSEGIPMDLSWPDAKVVVLLEPEDDDVADLESEGWRVMSADVDRVKALLTGTRSGNGTGNGSEDGGVA